MASGLRHWCRVVLPQRAPRLALVGRFCVPPLPACAVACPLVQTAHNLKSRKPLLPHFVLQGDAVYLCDGTIGKCDECKPKRGARQTMHGLCLLVCEDSSPGRAMAPALLPATLVQPRPSVLSHGSLRVQQQLELPNSPTQPVFPSMSLPCRRVQRRRQGHRRLEQGPHHIQVQGRQPVQVRQEVQQGGRLCARADHL